MSVHDQLRATVEAMTQRGKGLLAADESLGTITKRFDTIGLESTAENRRAYRSLLFGTRGAAEFISGVILFEETLGQKDDAGKSLVQVLVDQGIVPGIKVDKGTAPLAHAPGDDVTQGLDGLADRLRTYREQGARFAKWRATYRIGDRNPSQLAIDANAQLLARYAAICQEQGVVPIVEPEVLMDGDHSIERCAEVTEAVLHEVFASLFRNRVVLEHMILKPNMVIPGKEHGSKAGSEQVAAETIRVLKRRVPAAVPGIMFLSGGQTPAQATENLNAMNAMDPNLPWVLSFSYGRALQDHALKAWRGQAASVEAAQNAYLQRARLNGLACRGQYRPELEKQAA
ncbi:MAG TPA: class I fructose-bisphosphate aldolase [Burkholderiaceae bacterium]|nr:class I fructose-bisphosphate aldolase [Burkholderiaceae bacterium]